MKKILIIDDEKDFCFFIKKNLEETGDYQVDVCFESSEAIKQVKDSQPDVILLDFMMPGKSGIDILSELQNNKDLKNIPVIFLSAIIKEEEVQKHKNIIGNGHFISKPVKTDELIQAISKMTKTPPPPKDKIRTVTFLSREQIDFLDKLGKDAMFARGYKLSRAEILAELVDFLAELLKKNKKLNLNEASLAKSILKMISP